jgi:hypothetical protein
MSQIASHVICATATVLLVNCAGAGAQPVPIAGTSKTMTVKGQYQPLRIDEVGGVTLKGAQLVVRGSFESVFLRVLRVEKECHDLNLLIQLKLDYTDVQLS